MKKVLLALSACAFILASCHDHPTPPPTEHCRMPFKFHGKVGGQQGLGDYIPAQEANIMISSYLNSINYQQEDTDLHALIYNADSLRSYLSDPNVASVKFMFAHTMQYIQQGGLNKYAGYQAGALTFVIAGYDKNGNYVFHYNPKTTNPMVEDHCDPCPSSCPPNGSASADTLIYPVSGGGK